MKYGAIKEEMDRSCPQQEWC